jgi:chitinase
MRALIAVLFLSVVHGARYVTYIDKITGWWPPEAIATSIGVPGYAPASGYNVINLAFWTSGGTPVDAALVWANAYEYVSADNPWGNSTQAVQKAWLDAYHAAGIKVFVSAFGDSDYPTGKDPSSVGKALANFVITNQLDGVDIDYEDNNAMNQGIGEQWLITLTTTLRSALGTSRLISHAPQAPYFMGSPQYPSGGYLTVDQKAGSSIDWYNIQYYNQGTSDYTTYQSLFKQSTGWATNTSVYQIGAKVNLQKLVVGKPVTTGDATNTGYVAVNSLASDFTQAQGDGGWKAGYMGWQYYSDINLTGNTWSKTLTAAFK